MHRLIAAAFLLLLSCVGGTAVAQVAPHPTFTGTITGPDSGTWSSTGISATGANVTGTGGYKQFGAPILNQSNVSQGSLLAGTGAGASLPAGSEFSTFLGWKAGNAFTGATGEATCVGTIACELLVGGSFDSAFGEHAMGFELTGSNDVADGNDSMRNTTGVTDGTAIGKNSHKTYFGQNSTAAGFFALAGNAAGIVITGTKTTGDTMSLIFTDTAIAHSPVTVSYTMLSGDTLATGSAALCAAVSAAGIDPNLFCDSPPEALSGTYASAFGIAFVSTSTISGSYGATLTVTSSVSGAATEVITITGGVSATAGNNVAVGDQAMIGFLMTTANHDVAVGSSALAALTTGSSDTAVGYLAGAQLSTGGTDVLIGAASGTAATTPNSIVGVGYASLNADTTGDNNTAVGYQSGLKLTTAGSNTLIGSNAGQQLTTNGGNTVVGGSTFVGASGSTAQNNSIVGYNAWGVVSSAFGNVSVGANSGAAVTSGGYNVLLGYNVAHTTLTTGSNNILICTGQTACDVAASGTSNTFQLEGNSATPIMTVTGTNTPSTQVVTVNGSVLLPNLGTDAGKSDATVCDVTASGTLYYGSGTGGICLTTSTRRFKFDIAPEREGLAQLMGLRPVGFNYKPGHGYDPAKRYNGFIAEEMDGVLPELVGHDEEGKPNSVDLMGLVPILVRAVQQQQAEINDMKSHPLIH